VLFVAGAANYYGAPSFSALSLLKAGGGYARLAAPRSMTPHLASIGSEVVFAPQAETQAGTLSLDNLEPLVELSNTVDFVVLGPGLSLVEETQELALQLSARIEKPLLVDGDGLTAISQDTSVIKKRSKPTVLTPHVGEMARIARKSKEEVQADPVGIVQQTSQDLGAVTVLKGARSLTGLPDGRVFINLSGNSGMASAGSGDVLTGTIAAMYGLGLEFHQAVKTGVFMHGLAGDVAAGWKGADGITARDILEALPVATKSYREQYADITKNHYNTVEVL
jgi:NAD(P)H-hydrate epimerase